MAPLTRSRVGSIWVIINTQFDQDSKPYLPVILAGQSPLIDQMIFRTSRPLAHRIIARSHLQGTESF